MDHPRRPGPRHEHGGVPIIIGACGKRRAPELAVRHASDVDAGFQSPEATGTLFARIDKECVRQSRAPGSLIRSAAKVVCIAKHGATLRRRAQAIADIHEALAGQA
ncbi:MAG: hypothetical protein ABIU87_10885 [Ornithinibacter sp.]